MSNHTGSDLVGVLQFCFPASRSGKLLLQSLEESLVCVFVIDVAMYEQIGTIFSINSCELHYPLHGDPTRAAKGSQLGHARQGHFDCFPSFDSFIILSSSDKIFSSSSSHIHLINSSFNVFISSTVIKVSNLLDWSKA